jgi:predicted ArsR family transcriptional regulator
VLTEDAERLFPKAYDVLLNQLIVVLKDRLKPAEIEQVLREVGRAVAAGTPAGNGSNIKTHIRRALKFLETIGGAVKVDHNGDKIVIASSSCPLAAAVSVHPEVCRLAETMVAEIVKVPVAEHCDRDGRPRCRFEISHKEPIN